MTGNLVFTEGGRPMLSDASLTSGGEDAARDVAALVALAQAALGERRAGPVHAALSAQVSDAAELTAIVRAAAPARPITLHETRAVASEEPAEPEHSRGRRA